MAQSSSESPPKSHTGNSFQLSATEYQQQQQRQSNNTSAQQSLFSGPDAITFQPAAVTPSLDDSDEYPKHNSDHGADSKRRRIARACDQCRKKKIKCDGKTPSCTHCQNYHTECVFTLVEKKRQPPKGAKYIEGLENRLGRMESLLKLSGILPESDTKTDLGTLEKRLEAQRILQPGTSGSSPGNALFSRPVSSNGTPNSGGVIHGSSPSDNGKEEEETESLSEKMSSLVTNSCGETRFIGSSSGFSIFSPKGIQWVNAKTGDKRFQKMLLKPIQDMDHKFDHWRPDVWDALFANKCSNPLPSKAEASAYVSDFFKSLNILFPLYHQETFESLLEQQYSDNPPQGSGWYASLNIVMAIGCRLRSVKARSPIADEESRGWKYFQNAACMFPAIALQNTDILSIQALLGMGLFLQGTANPQPLYNIIATAVRVAFAIGLHRRADAFGFERAEAEQRKRVFWIAYIIDKDIALRSGRPSAINDDDVNVELPEEESFDGLGMINLVGGRGKVNLFRRNCVFAQIQSRVYMQLYSAKAARQSDGELLNTIGELDSQLEEWRDSIPLDFRPEHEIAEAYQATTLPVVVMHFAYFNCLATIHRMSIAHSYWTNRLAKYAVSGLNSRPLNPRVFSSAALSVSAARSSIHLLKYVNMNDSNCVWLVLYYPVTALITLFANILQNPQDSNAKTDLQLMGIVVTFLNSLDENDKNNCGVEKLIYFTTEFVRLAQVAIEKAEKEALMRRKRKKQTGGTTGMSKIVESDDENTRFQVPNGKKMNWTSAHPSGSSSDIAMDEVAGLTFGQHNPNEAMSVEGFNFTYNTPGDSGNISEETELSPLTKTFPESFSSPFVPQGLWNLNQTFEWDWANFGGMNTLNGGSLGLGEDGNNISWDGMNLI